MNRPRALPVLLILLGFVSSVITVVSFQPEYGPIDAGQPELATVFILVISLGFVVTGWLWIREPDTSDARYPQVPALTLSVLGLSGIVGVVVVFRPWDYGGLAGGLRGLLMFVSLIVGTALLLAGWRWTQAWEVRYPLSFLAGALVLGLFYVAHQRLDFLIPIPRLAVIVAVVLVVPILAVLYGFSPRPSVR